tara:strand:- start:70 stop:735 length:666 start_codon:yes stop_codon:yes gene_type:complete
MENKKITALVPVKGDSERVPKKNLRPFCNTTLYELKLEQLQSAKSFENIIISSENEEVLNIAIERGFDVHYRDALYSTSDVPMSDVYSYVASEIPGENIAWVNITNPLVTADIYDHAVETFSRLPKKYDCLLSAYELKEYVFYKDKPVNFKPYPHPKSQDLTDMVALSFAINILKREDMIRWGSAIGSKPYFYMIDNVVSTDIDYTSDFKFCEMIYKEWNE